MFCFICFLVPFTESFRHITYKYVLTKSFQGRDIGPEGGSSNILSLLNFYQMTRRHYHQRVAAGTGTNTAMRPIITYEYPLLDGRDLLSFSMHSYVELIPDLFTSQSV
jgi:hypothetical protein